MLDYIHNNLVVAGMMRFLLLASLITSIVACERKTNSEKGTGLDKRVFDSVAILSGTEEEDLTNEILTFEKNVGPQIAIIIVDTLNGEKIEEYSLRNADRMRLGRKEFDDGLLITLSVKDHKVRIEVGYGLEKIIKDEIAARIIREDMIPEFKKQKFYAGLKAALSRIRSLIEENRPLIGQKP